MKKLQKSQEKSEKNTTCSTEPKKSISDLKEENRVRTLKFKNLHKKLEKLLEINHAAFIALPNQETGVVELRLLDIDDAKEFEKRLKGSFQEQLRDSIIAQGDTISSPENKNKQDEKINGSQEKSGENSQIKVKAENDGKEKIN